MASFIDLPGRRAGWTLIIIACYLNAARLTVRASASGVQPVTICVEMAVDALLFNS